MTDRSDFDGENTVAYTQEGFVDAATGRYFIAYVVRDEPGYYQTAETYRELAEAKAAVEKRNALRGFSAEQVEEIVNSSFRAQAGK